MRNNAPEKAAAFDAVLFDFDGTIADTSEGIHACLNEAFAELGYPAIDSETLRPCLGPPLQITMRDIAGLPEHLILPAIELYREAYAAGGCFRLRIYDGMEALLQRLSAAGIPAAVASAKPTVYLEKILGHFDMRRYFAAVSGAEPTRTDSGKADILLRAAKGCGADPARCLMVGDRKYDMASAKELGMGALGVLYGFGGREELLAAGADALVASCGEVERYIFE